MWLFEVMISFLHHALKVHSDHVIPGSHPPTPTGEHGGASQFRPYFPYFSRVPPTHPNFNMVVPEKVSRKIFLAVTLPWNNLRREGPSKWFVLGAQLLFDRLDKPPDVLHRMAKHLLARLLLTCRCCCLKSCLDLGSLNCFCSSCSCILS